MQVRQEKRRIVKLPCQVRTEPGMSAKTSIMPSRATLRDLSAGGCALRSPRLALRRDDRVLLSFDNREPLAAEVSWTRAGEGAGMRFARPLQRAEIDALASAGRRAAIEGLKSRATVAIARGRLLPV